MTELHVSKKTIGKLFSEMQNKKFVIPDYQRPYNWDVEKCETLWRDIEHFFQTATKTDADYFLGTIVTYINGDKNPEIIDGQQRITSFLLLLRAFYKKLENMAADEEVTGLKIQLAPCIWDVDKISQVVTDRTKIHILSKVATEENKGTFHKILETGDASESGEDNYSKNYRFFLDKCDDFAKENPMQWKEFCVDILNHCIILPIECDAQDTALTIFSTLNDRGMPLADSDIFKAHIYRNCATAEKKEEFAGTWTELTDICKEGGFSIDKCFHYYTHVLRARDKNKSSEIGLRKFYADDKYKRLTPDIIAEIMDLASFWRFINTGIEPDIEYSYSISTKARIWLHCLDNYPNEYWKYLVTVFFMKNRASQTFENDFEVLLRKLTAYLFSKFIAHPTVNAIKWGIYSACISLNENEVSQLRFDLDEGLLDRVGEQIESASWNISKALLLLYAYLHPDQKELIPADKLQIEHILPQKWQDTNYNGWSEDDAKQYLERFGNKTIFERKLNIQAGNGYFGEKKKKYKESKIATVRALADYPKNDWGKEDIEQREEKFKKTLLRYFRENLDR